MGAAYVAGMATGIYDLTEIYGHIQRKDYQPQVSTLRRETLYTGWKRAIWHAINGEKI